MHEIIHNSRSWLKSNIKWQNCTKNVNVIKKRECSSWNSKCKAWRKCSNINDINMIVSFWFTQLRPHTTSRQQIGVVFTAKTDSLNKCQRHLCFECTQTRSLKLQTSRHVAVTNYSTVLHHFTIFLRHVGWLVRVQTCLFEQIYLPESRQVLGVSSALAWQQIYYDN